VWYISSELKTRQIPVAATLYSIDLTILGKQPLQSKLWWYLLMLLIFFFWVEEELTLEQFRPLRDEDLQSLGFKMGARRMLMSYNWSSGLMNMPSASVQPASVETPAIQPTTSQPKSPPRDVVVDGSRPTRATMTVSLVCILGHLVLLFFLNLWIIYMSFIKWNWRCRLVALCSTCTGTMRKDKELKLFYLTYKQVLRLLWLPVHSTLYFHSLSMIHWLTAMAMLHGFVFTFQLALEFLFNTAIVSTTTQSVVIQYKLTVNTVLLNSGAGLSWRLK